MLDTTITNIRWYGSFSTLPEILSASYVQRKINRHRISQLQYVVLSACLWCLFGNAVIASEDYMLLKQMSLDDLINLEVSIASKKPEKVVDTTAAVFVVTSADIRRSGSTTIPDILRMVPGLHVANIDSNTWAVTARGFNGRFASKLLVLIDGRSVYTPLFSGVFWDSQDTLLEDIDRIEVIRGPGAAVWGANAVNGVINIITKTAANTQGGLVVVGAGNEERGFGSFRYGGKLGDDTHYRIYGKYFDKDEAVFVNGDDATDDWDSLRGGFRVDWSLSENNSFTLQGDVYDLQAGQRIGIPSLITIEDTIDQEINANGYNLLGRWRKISASGSTHAVQAYYSKTIRIEELVNDTRDTFDVEYQQNFSSMGNHDLAWGVGYRYISDEIPNDKLAQFVDETENASIYSVFIQDSVTLQPKQLFLTLGMKLEHNEDTGIEPQPNTRLLWHPKDSHSVWFAISQAARTPGRSEKPFSVDASVVPASPATGGLPLLVRFGSTGNNIVSEKLTAYELGYRLQASKKFNFDVAAFYNEYKKLRAVESDGPPTLAMTPVPHLVSLLTVRNNAEGETYGFEIAVDWQAIEWWQLRTAYSNLNMRMKIDNGSTDTFPEEKDRNPKNLLSIQSRMDIVNNMQLDLWARYVDKISAFNIDSYVALDARIAWNLRKDLELSLVGRNLLEDSHREYESIFVKMAATEVEREFYLKADWRF